MTTNYLNIDTQFQWLLNHRQELIERYPDRFIVISNERVVGDFTTEDEAYLYAVKKFKLGDFLLQLISNNEECFNERFEAMIF